MTSRKKRRKRKQRLTGLSVLVVLLLLCVVIGFIALRKDKPEEIDYTQLVSAVTPAATEEPVLMPTPEPEPEITEAPAVTEEPVVAEEPVITEQPEEPEITEAPEAAEEPVAEEDPQISVPEATVQEELAPAETEPEETAAPALRTFTLSAAGDCTLGGDINGSSYKRFHNKIAEKGYDWCFKNVAPIFEADDITVINLEVALTTETKGRKSNSGVEFWMRGKPENVKLLENCGIDVCNLSNNHTIDFKEKGLQDTKDNLASINMPYCDYDEFYVADVKGVKVGFLGFSEWYISVDDMVSMIKKCRPECEVLVVSLHAGSELKYEATSSQQKYAHAIIDAGGDLVIGSHSHVVGGIEKYKGKYIVYSLGNFCFGGKSNPADHDTFIYQQTFTVNENGEITDTSFEIVPCYISSVTDTNNYQPTPVTSEKEISRIIKKIRKYSKNSDN